MTHFVEHLESTAQDSFGFLHQQQLEADRTSKVASIFPSICVHLCLSVVHFFVRRYSKLSERAWTLASMILSCTPTVPHSSLPSVDSIRTRVRAPVPAVESRIRTL